MSTILENQEIIKRPKRKLRRFLKVALRSFKWVQAFGLLLLFGCLVWFGVSQSSHFALQKIEVAGDLKELTREELIRSASIPLGVSLFAISLKEVEKNILKLPWVQSVSIRRQAPQTLWIHVREQKPAALLLDSRLYFVSQEGVVFKEVQRESPGDLPVLTGFKKGDSLEEVASLLHFLENFVDFEVFGLSEIHYNGATGFSVVTLLGPMEVRLGRDGFEGKLKRLKAVWTELESKLGRVKGIDLNYEDRAFVKL